MKSFYLTLLVILSLGSFSCYDMMNTTLSASLDASSMASSDSDNTETTVEQSQIVPQALPDTVYLKDGSIIHGRVIEEVPGESLKIRTRVGNVFTYQMTDVAKISHHHAPVNEDDDQVQDPNTAPGAPPDGADAEVDEPAEGQEQ